MAQLNPNPKTSTTAQRKRLVQLGLRRGMSVDDLRAMAGCGLRELSSRDASAMITRLDGGDLPNPPGERPKAPRRRPTPGVTRMRTADQVEQINRLMLFFFDGDVDSAANWLEKNFNVRDPEKLATAERAGHVIGVLLTMTKRKEAQSCVT